VFDVMKQRRKMLMEGSMHEKVLALKADNNKKNLALIKSLLLDARMEMKQEKHISIRF